jgi:hypothetical protein
MALLRRAAKHPADERVQGAWSALLGLDQLHGHELQTATSEALNDLRSEIELVQEELRSMRVPDDLIRLPINSALELTSPASWRGAWKAHRETHLRAEVLVAWGWVTWLLPSEEDEISPEDIKELETQLKELEAAANDEGVPDQLRRFIFRQATRIRTALTRYTTKGQAPLKEAFQHGLGEVVTERKVLTAADTSAPAAKKAMEKLVRCWATVAKFTSDVKSMDEFWELLVTKGWPALSRAAEGVKGLLERLPDGS